MNRRIHVIATVLAAGLFLPAAAAGWVGYGDQEPSTHYDSSEYMFDSPTTNAQKSVYFNAYAAPFLTGANPNAAALETAFQGYPLEYYGAMLGLWKDCNGDGYVGMAEQGATVYRAELLLDNSICGPELGTTVHNDGAWVHEYIPFVMLDPCTWATEGEREDGSGHVCEGFTPSAYYLNQQGLIFVNNTRIWGDSNAPDSIAEPAGTCALSPVPRGTTAHTGLALRYAGCVVGAGQRINQVDGIVFDLTGQSTGLAFDNPRDPQDDTDHPLVFALPINLYGNPRQGEDGQTGLIEENSESKAYRTYDCNARTDVNDPTGGSLRHVSVSDPTGVVPATMDVPGLGEVQILEDDGHILHANGTDDSGRIASVWAPAPSLLDADGSYYDGANDTWDGVGVYALGASDGDCDASTRNDFPVGNSRGTLDGTSTSSAQDPAKRKNSWTFRWTTSASGVNPWGVGDGELKTVVGERAPPIALQNYYTDSVIVNNLPRSGARTDGETAPVAPEYYSFYAAVDLGEMDALGASLPAGSAHFTYGAEQCPVPGSNLGWDCDPDTWWLDASGADVFPKYQDGTPRAARVGDPFHLRDVDCYDQSVNGVVLGNLERCV